MSSAELKLFCGIAICSQHPEECFEYLKGQELIGFSKAGQRPTVPAIPFLCVDLDQTSAAARVGAFFAERIGRNTAVEVELQNIANETKAILECGLLQSQPVLGWVQETAMPLLIADEREIRAEALRFVKEVCLSE